MVVDTDDWVTDLPQADVAGDGQREGQRDARPVLRIGRAHV